MKRDEWGRDAGPNGLAYRSFGQTSLRFVVPQCGTVQVINRLYHAGDTVDAPDFTMYWG